MSRKILIAAVLATASLASASPVLAEGHAGASGANNKAVVKLPALLGGKPVVVPVSVTPATTSSKK